MQPLAIPEHEPARLQALHDLAILDTPAEERFDRLTRLAQHVFGTPIALVSLVDAERQWFKSRQGVDACETGRGISFCGHAILDDGIFQVTDARLDPRFADNPLVTGGPHIRFYAGAPLKSAEGHRLGTLCIIDDKPRKLSAQEELALRELADCVEEEINRSEQKHTEIALREVVHRTQAILDTMVDGLLTIDQHGIVQTANHSAERIFGYSAEEMIGRNVKMLMPEPFRGEHDGYLHNYLTSGQAKIIGMGRTVTGLRKDGSTFPMDLSVGEMKGEGDSRMFTGIVRDVTERMTAARRLEEQRQFALDMIGALTIPTFIIDADHRVLVWNRACEELTGVPAADVIGTKDVWRGFYSAQRPCLADFVLERHDESLAAYYAHIDTSHFSERGLHAEGWFPDMNGKRRYLMFDTAPIFNSAGKMVAAIESLDDITERKLTEEELKQFKNTLDQTLDCVFMFDANNLLFFYVNEGAMQQVGYTRDELLTMHPYDIKPEFSEPQFRELIAPLLAGEQASFNFETVHQHKNGQRVPVEVFLQYIADDPAHFVAIVRDITERQKIDRMKSEFISTVSHELRTPLTSIVGSLGLVIGGMAGELAPQGKTLIDLAHKNSQRLVELINDILDIEKIESGSMTFDMQPMALMPLLAESLEATKGYFEHHGNRCALVASVDAGVKVNVAEGRLMQVMANLLSNAAKFAPRDSQVEVGAELRGDLVRVWVRDDGPGIPEEFRSRMFQKFSQADSSDTRQKGGSGLGLSIVKAMLERMNGRIAVDSVEGQGATFYFELPVWDTATENHEANAQARHILVCEDDRDTAGFLQLLLEKEGYRVDVAHSSEEARTLLAQHRYDAMTLDLLLPGEDGMTFLHALRADAATHDLPVVVVSADAKAVSTKHIRGLSVLDCMEKPIDQQRLLAALAGIRLANGGRTRILHVEDEADIRQVVLTLVGDQAQVVSAATLAAARQQLEQGEFDLIILDLGLPDGNGADLLPYLKRHNLSTPVLVFSAQEVSGAVARQIAAALVKTRSSNEQLLETIQRLCGKD